jgi:hypothetical protein
MNGMKQLRDPCMGKMACDYVSGISMPDMYDVCARTFCWPWCVNLPQGSLRVLTCQYRVLGGGISEGARARPIGNDKSIPFGKGGFQTAQGVVGWGSNLRMCHT